MYSNSAVSVHTDNIVQFNTPRTSKGWQYLLADSLAFQKQHIRQHGHTIRIQKPDSQNLPTWIKRLVISGQCEAIFVEDLQLSEEEHLTIKALCTKFCVSLVGLSINDEYNNNVVQGPW